MKISAKKLKNIKITTTKTEKICACWQGKEAINYRSITVGAGQFSMVMCDGLLTASVAQYYSAVSRPSSARPIGHKYIFKIAESRFKIFFGIHWPPHCYLEPSARRVTVPSEILRKAVFFPCSFF